MSSASTGRRRRNHAYSVGGARAWIVAGKHAHRHVQRLNVRYCRCAAGADGVRDRQDHHWFVNPTKRAYRLL
jgi:hypothetical protein